MQTEPPCQHFQRIRGYLLRLLAKLTVEIRVVMRVHAALECFGGGGTIKEPRCDTQGADPVTSSPCGAHFVGLAFHVGSPRIWELLALYRNLIRSSRTNFEIGPPPPYWRGK